MIKIGEGLRTYRRLLRFSQKYWGIFLLGVIGTILLSLIDAGFTWLIKPIINEGFINRNELFIRWLPLLIVLIFLLRGVAGFVSNYFIGRVARHVVMDFRRRIFEKLLRLPAKFYDHHSSGHLLSTIIYNVSQVAQASSDALLIMLRESSLMIGLLVVMFTVDWRLSLLFLVTVPFIGGVVKWSSKRLRRLSSNVQESVGDVTRIADEGIEGYKVIRLYDGQGYETQKFHKVTKQNLQRELKIIITNSVGTSTVQLLVAIPIAVTLLFATMPSLHVTAGSFAAVVAAMLALLRPVRRLTNVNSEIQKGVAGAASIFEILDEASEKDHGTQTVVNSKGDIAFKEVYFQYTSEAPVLQNINFTIKPGQILAIVGRSGSGKTTLVNLLPRFYDPQEGVITMDGIDIKNYRLADLRSQIAFVSQDTMLFDDTVANNIAYAKQGDVTEDEIIEAAKAAHAMEFIRQLPKGLQTMVGEDGVLLSGGQRQRIAIARALLKNAPILILDEATSSLDSHSERHIQQALEKLMQSRSTLVIAHRLSTIEGANWIIVVDKGHIIEQGTHHELLQKQGAYADLHRLQFKEAASVETV